MYLSRRKLRIQQTWGRDKASLQDLNYNNILTFHIQP